MARRAVGGKPGPWRKGTAPPSRAASVSIFPAMLGASSASPRKPTTAPREADTPDRRAWSNTNRRPRPADWKAIRVRILTRDGHACQWPTDTNARCGMPANEVDHITPVAEGGSDDDINLRALCRSHHHQKTTQEAAAGRARAEAARPRRRINRDEEQHPADM